MSDQNPTVSELFAAEKWSCATYASLHADEGLWTIGSGGAVLLSSQLPEAFRTGFVSEVMSPADLVPKYLKWHRNKVFKP
ncbi:hypothetical protein D7V80_12905 [Corallococcus sp. CA054B]|uniref:hypothetical protein n=1 Tax=Corallococcus sp. CA054B TaxID=2316734 RepID=UPI000ED6F54C|nr:hypothetical protein [Corallococcus sp. CA054B]RKG68302.1 hypothetical protein D7V80_12905 [Corallococcus sp. CA054B]